LTGRAAGGFSAVDAFVSNSLKQAFQRFIDSSDLNRTHKDATKAKVASTQFFIKGNSLVLLSRAEWALGFDSTEHVLPVVEKVDMKWWVYGVDLR
jgi:hypothetical protein